MIRCFKDPTYVLMRVLLCKIQCPSFICFCKPSPHISLKLDHTTQVDHDAHVEQEEEVVDHVDDLLNEEEDCGAEKEEKPKQEEEQGHCNGEILKSSLRKAEDGERREKKKVQWVDVIGKELAEVREFHSSEEDNIRYDGDKSCVCVIL